MPKDCRMCFVYYYDTIQFRPEPTRRACVSRVTDEDEGKIRMD